MKVDYEEEQKLIRNLKYVSEKQKDKFVPTFELNVYEMVSEVISHLENMIAVPTWEEVVNAWQETADDKIEIQRNDKGIRINYSNGIYYFINLERVYSNSKLFSINVNEKLYAINLTIRYLEENK